MLTDTLIMVKSNLAAVFGKATQKQSEPKTPIKESASQQKNTAPSRQGKRGIVAYVDPLVIRELKILSADIEKSQQDLFVEALNDLFIKHGKKPIA